MGLFKSLKGNLPDRLGHDGDEYTPPPGPPPSHSHPHAEEYAPPPGPPPSHTEYAPPPGPPPSHTHYAPPPGPPPSQKQSDDEPPPYHDWTVIPDTSLLPPPPALGHFDSPSSNADVSDAMRAYRWCQRNPLIQPHQPTPAQHATVKNGDVRLSKPPEFIGTLTTPRPGLWRGSTKASSKDSCLLTAMPLYFAIPDSPFNTEAPKTIYFEVTVVSFGSGSGPNESSLALGYCAVPYPSWRMPGWERGSLAVHADDGRRYINDASGGKDFTSPIRAGETVGIGITYSLPENPSDYRPSPVGGSSLKGEVFFTRNGKKDGGWSLQEEIDADSESGDTLGLDGKFDLHAAIGTFSQVSFEVKFNSRDWLWQPN